jgi:transcriptional regulator with XRE-family HTH domain
MSQAVLADLAGVSQAYISQIESGLRTIERRSTLLAIAEALQIPASELVSPSEHVGLSYAQAHAAIPSLRVAIAELQAGERGQLLRSPEQLALAMDEVDRRILKDGDWAGVVPYLADIVMDASAIGGETYARAMEQAVSPLLALGYRDLAWLVADFALRVARDAELWAWIGASACSLVFTLPVEVRGSARIAQTVADEIQHYTNDENVRQVYGELHVTAALAEAVGRNAGRAHDRLSEAEHAALSLGEPVNAGFAHKGFGPSNVNYWRMNVANELGDHDLVPDIASRIDPKVFTGPSLRCFYWMQLGRAHVAMGNDAEALVAMINSESQAPQIFQHHRSARDSVITLVRRARRRALPSTLVRLAHSVGADTENS